jgi:hypothetical protein
MNTLGRKLTYANVVATLALVIAVAGGSTAIAVSASKSADVTPKGKIRAGRVTTTKLADGAVTATKVGAIDIVQASGPGGTPVTCPAGERVLAGGGQPGGTASLAFSIPQGNGWVAGPTNPAAGITVYALCLKS